MKKKREFRNFYFFVFSKKEGKQHHTTNSAVVDQHVSYTHSLYFYIEVWKERMKDYCSGSSSS